ncbi:hypothetical protein [Streptomyces sioyaensis]|uniref:hypothetical protein n=1 Tax=Streptomyces sioyaensis TaxID=67364 RepID=UPI00379866AF
MATLMQAVERVRNDGQLPTTGSVTMTDLHRRFPPTTRGSTRSLIDKMYQGATKLPWAIILCRFKNAPADPVREAPIERFYRDAFTPRKGGLVEYWRDVSLGKIDISGSRVFGWLPIDIDRKNANTGSGVTRSTLVDAAIRGARAAGFDPVTGFHSQIAVYIENWSKNGAPPGADWSDPTWGQFWIDGSADGRGKVTLTPPHDADITAHEMGHGFSMAHDMDINRNDYADPCCIMSQNNAFVPPGWNVAFGPGLCLAHLQQKGWMYPRRFYVDSGGWQTQPGGISLPLAAIRDPGARANLGVKLAFSRPGSSWDYFLEYVTPEDWNRGLGSPFVFIRRMGGQQPVILGSIAVPTTLGSVAQFVEPSGRVRFTVERFDATGRILKVGALKLP